MTYLAYILGTVFFVGLAIIVISFLAFLPKAIATLYDLWSCSSLFVKITSLIILCGALAAILIVVL